MLHRSKLNPWTVFEHFSAQLSSWVWFPPRLLRPKLEICYGLVQLARARRYHCLWLVSGLLPLSFISTAFSCNCKMLEEVLGLCTMYFDETVVFLKRKKISFFVSCVYCFLQNLGIWRLPVASLQQWRCFSMLLAVLQVLAWDGIVGVVESMERESIDWFNVRATVSCHIPFTGLFLSIFAF